MSARWSVRRARARVGGAFVLAAVAAAPLIPLSGTPAGAETLTVGAAADATAWAASPDRHEGSAGTLEIDGSPEKEAFLRFSVPVLPAPVGRATLRLFAVDGSGNGPEVYRATAGWDEASLGWSQRPARTGGVVTDVGAVHGGTWTAWDVTAAVTGPGPLALALVPDSTDGADFSSREAGQNPPQLVLEVGSALTAATFAPVADGRVDENHSGSNYGTSSTLSAQGEPDPPMESYLRFTVSGLAGPVRRATLRLFVTNATNDGPGVFGVTGAWDEAGLTWENRPGPAGPAIADAAGVAEGWVDYDVTRAVPGAGTFNFALVSSSADSFGARAREATAAERPQLVVETDTAPTTQPPSSTTTTTQATTTTSSSTTTTTRPPAADCDPPDWRPAEVVGRLPSGYAEMSGLVGSTRYPGWAWGVRDSGNPASLYAFRLPGSGGGEVDIFEFPVPGTSNSDWEDVAYTRDGTGPGTLWILENRGNAFVGNRTLYQVAEPDPAKPGPAQLIGRYTIAYPDGQWNSETLFVFNNDLALISKTSPARVYRFLTKPLPLTVNIPVLVGALPEVSNPSIGSVSPDGRLLAVASHSTIRVYENRGDLLELLDLIARPAVFRESMPNDNREGGAFFPAGSCDIVMVSESKNLWRLEHR